MSESDRGLGTPLPAQDLAGRTQPALARPLSLRQTASAVFWSFFGVRRQSDYEADVQRLNPVHLVVAGLMGGAIFVLALVMLVRWVIQSGVAQ